MLEFLEISYWAYYYNLNEEEFWSMIVSNQVSLKAVMELFTWRPE